MNMAKIQNKVKCFVVVLVLVLLLGFRSEARALTSSSRIGASPPRLPSPTLHLLFKDYHSDQKFSITTYSPDGIVITSSGTKKGDLFFADVNTQRKHRNVTTDIKVDADSNMAEHLNFSSVVGTNILAIGTDVSYDTKSGDLTKLNAGLCFTKADFIASLMCEYLIASSIVRRAFAKNFQHLFLSNFYKRA
ncbi:hypothetical protein K1719_002643 [Acacia pycnantha]|nr:hypothetical protein K1719_002643 [Acacia pycnantha]